MFKPDTLFKISVLLLILAGLLILLRHENIALKLLSYLFAISTLAGILYILGISHEKKN